MSEVGSISKILVDMKHGDELAAEQLWNRLVAAVAARARRQLDRYRVRGADQEDIAIDVFASLCRGAQNDRFPRLNDRDDLWQILMMLVRQKVIDRKRKKHPELTESVLGAKDPASSELWGVAAEPGNELPGDAIAEGADTLQVLLDALDEPRRSIALLRMDGYNNKEIASRLGTSLRSVERKVGLIKLAWESQLNDEPIE